MLEVAYSNGKFTCIVQICILVTACTIQPLLPFWSYPEQCWKFALINVA